MGDDCGIEEEPTAILTIILDYSRAQYIEPFIVCPGQPASIKSATCSTIPGTSSSNSGDSSSLAYKGELLLPYTPRPVPHVVALLPPDGHKKASCLVVKR